MADVICRRLHFSNADRKQIVELVAHHMDFMNVQQMRPAKLRRLLAMDRFDEHLQLHRADCLASHGHIENYEFCQAKIAEFARTDAEPVLPSPLLTGDNLMALGYKPGPYLGKILRILRDAQLNGEITTPEQAMAWILEEFPLERIAE